MLGLLVLSVSLMVLDYRQDHISRLRSGLATLISPLQKIVAVPADFVNWTSNKFQSHSDLIDENDQLQDEVFILRGQAQKLIALEAEVSRLKSLMGAVSDRSEQRQIADIISVRASEFHHEVLINKGAEDGVYIGQPVIDANGIMGQVSEVAEFSSRIILITDERHAIPVRDLRNDVRAIAAGTGRLDRMSLIQVPHSVDIKENDMLVTSGLGQKYPSGFPVAKVTLVRHDAGENYAYIEVTPLARLSRSGQIILIWPADKPDNTLIEEE
jgi:rod shape-determining protein MreC